MPDPRLPREREGYWGNKHTPREREWYIALAEKVGHQQAPNYADYIILWKQGRPPDNILEKWLFEHEDGDHTVSPRVQTRVDNKVDRHFKMKHILWLQKMMDAGIKAIEPVEETGEMAQPVLIKYLADGVNQGMMLHQTKIERQSDTIAFSGLTINVGKPPTPRKLRQRNDTVDAEFKELPAGDDERD